MNDRLGVAVNELLTLDPSLRPVPFADRREKALSDGLHGLAERFGHTIAPTHINSNGEMPFIVVAADGRTCA